jgi:AcrR family transcriptional regulator
VRTKTAQQADKMLDAAARLFGTQRFHEVRMEDIAAEAGVGKGTLYRYFSDKEELYLALLERASKQILARLEDDLRAAGSPGDRLRAVVAGIIDFFDGQPHLLDLIQRAEVIGGPDFPWQQARDELLRLVLDLFKEGKAHGAFAVRDPETAVLLLLGGVRAVIRFGKRPRPRGLADRIVAAFLQGSAADDAPPVPAFAVPSRS